MNISKEIKKAEAINRMKALGLFAPCIKAFKDRNEVQLSEPTGGLYEFSADKELTAKVAEFDYWQWFDSTEDFYDPHGHCCDICGKEFEDGETVILVDE